MNRISKYILIATMTIVAVLLGTVSMIVREAQDPFLAPLVLHVIIACVPWVIYLLVLAPSKYGSTDNIEFKRISGITWASLALLSSVIVSATAFIVWIPAGNHYFVLDNKEQTRLYDDELRFIFPLTTKATYIHDSFTIHSQATTQKLNKTITWDVSLTVSTSGKYDEILAQIIRHKTKDAWEDAIQEVLADEVNNYIQDEIIPKDPLPGEFTFSISEENEQILQNLAVEPLGKVVVNNVRIVP